MIFMFLSFSEYFFIAMEFWILLYWKKKITFCTVICNAIGFIALDSGWHYQRNVAMDSIDQLATAYSYYGLGVLL